jgi:hypothetical protein
MSAFVVVYEVIAQAAEILTQKTVYLLGL